MRSPLIPGLLWLMLISPSLMNHLSGEAGSDMQLNLRKRIQPYGASETWTEANFEQNLAPTKTAILIQTS